MSGSVNKAIILGRLGKDPEARSTQGGQRIVTMSIATEETWRDKQSGERRKKTEWHRVVCFNEKLAEIIEKYVRKGDAVYIEGQIATREWQDQQGQKRHTTEIVLPRFGGALTMVASAAPREGGAQDQRSSAPRQQSAGRPAADLDDDIPF